MKRRLLARIAAAIMSLGVGLGFTQLAAADTISATESPTVVRSSTQYEDVSVGHTDGKVRGGGRSSLSALAAKLGEKEETVADALVAVRERERLAGVTRANHRGSRHAGVARALAAELGIDADKVSRSLTELRVERSSESPSAR